MLQIPALKDAKRSPRQGGFAQTQTCLYDLKADPQQQEPFRDSDIEADLCRAMCLEMRKHEVPDEIFHRFAL